MRFINSFAFIRDNIAFFATTKKKIASYRDSFAFICESYALSFESYAFIRSFYYLRKWLQWAFVSLRISAQNKKKLHQNCLFFYIHELTIFADINNKEIIKQSASSKYACTSENVKIFQNWYKFNVINNKYKSCLLCL